MISAQNQIKGRISNLQIGEAMSLVTIQADDRTIVSAVTTLGVKALDLKSGDTVTAVVKSTEAMLIKDGGPQIKSAPGISSMGRSNQSIKGRRWAS